MDNSQLPDSQLPFPLGRQARLAVLASGRGSNLQALLAAFPPQDPLAAVTLVVSDQPDALALRWARAAELSARYIAWGKRSEFEASLERELERHSIDLICLAGFMRILSARFVERYKWRVINIHPSLLPEFPGLHPQQRALHAGVQESGCTVHFVDSGVDSGPVIGSARVPVLDGDDVESLSGRILEQEHLLYPRAVRAVLDGRTAIEEFQ